MARFFCITLSLLYIVVQYGFSQPVDAIRYTDQINLYAIVFDVDTCTASLTVDLPNIVKPGDRVIIQQIYGADIDTTESTSFGTIKSLNGAGLFEFATVAEVVQNKIYLSHQLIHSYKPEHGVQVIKVASASVEEIEQLNILQATFLAMHRAISTLCATPHHLLIDGNRFKPLTIPHSCIIKGDSKSESIAAASILAKTARDSYMCEVVHKEFPRYNFEGHKGYGTQAHRNAIQEWGPTEVHRSLFLRKILLTPNF